MLLFADDIALFTTDSITHQLQLNCIYTYSTHWGLAGNVNKTKVCIFARRKQAHSFEWFINNVKLKEASHFYYLGIKILKTGNRRFGVEGLVEQGSKATNILITTFITLYKRVSLDVRTKLSLFNK